MTVFGPGAEGARRRAEGKPLIDKPITSELGGVGPVIVVPGRWSDAALRFQAENVATQRLHNSGFNCVATQVVVLPERWAQADRSLGYLRGAIRKTPSRPACYPGAADRQRAAVESHSRVKPVWFVTNRTAHITGEHMTRFAATPSLAKGLPEVVAAVRSSVRG